MNKCPRCENENLKEEYNYCPVCGYLISHQIRESSIKMLEAIRENFLNYGYKDEEEKKYLLLSVGALDTAIKELERTAPEVPVQEQSYNQ